MSRERELRAAIAGALRWAERTTALARETRGRGATHARIREALLATESLADRVESRRRELAGPRSER